MPFGILDEWERTTMDAPKSTLSNDLQSLRIDKKGRPGKSRRRAVRWIAGLLLVVLSLAAMVSTMALRAAA